jgi:hypothetical protein
MSPETQAVVKGALEMASNAIYREAWFTWGRRGEVPVVPPEEFLRIWRANDLRTYQEWDTATKVLHQ